jgi:acetyl esterase/lipase
MTTRNFLLSVLLLISGRVLGQVPEHIRSIFPEGTIFQQNIPYANDTLKKHLLDVYLPENVSGNLPLIIWIHGGAWLANDKYADMSYMTETLRSFLQKGYAVASIDYRYSSTAVFPAQIQDCIQAVQFLHDNSTKFKLDNKKFILTGFSSGGHLASLLALSANNNVSKFYPAGRKPSFRIKAVLDYYGPSELLLFYGQAIPGKDDSPIGKLLGDSPLLRPDLSKLASPVTYVDHDDPPFFIVHGERDQDVPPTQSYLLASYLDLAKVKNDLHVVKDAPHYGRMFDSEEVRNKLFLFLDEQVK